MKWSIYLATLGVLGYIVYFNPIASLMISIALGVFVLGIWVIITVAQAIMDLVS